MSCNTCQPNDGSAPPSGFSPTTSTPQGAQSSFCGDVTISSGPCYPVCPTPPTSSQVTRQPYTASWVENLFGSYAGKLLIKVGSALHYLRSGNSGWIRYNAQTESVVVDGAPPYASSAPRGTQFGYLAKTVPTPIQTLNEATGACQTVIHQEVASQVLDYASNGDLLVARPPNSAEVCSDAANQVRIDYVDPVVAEDETSVSDDIGFLVQKPVTTVIAGQTVIQKLWMRLRSIRLRRSQFGIVEKANYATARQLVAVPVPGGTADDPAYEMRMSVSQPSDPSTTFPANPNNGDTLFYNGGLAVANPNYPLNSWCAFSRGLGLHLLTTPVDLVIARTTAGSVTVTLPSYPVPNVSGIKGLLLISKVFVPVNSTFQVKVGSRVVGFSQYGANYGQFTIYFNPSPDSDQITFDFIKTGTGSVTADVSISGFYL